MSNKISKHTSFLYHKQNGLCYYCGTENMYLREDVTREFAAANRKLRATFDHIVPKSQGGKDSKDNGVCACAYCNSKKGDIPYEKFIEKFNPELIRSIVKVQLPGEDKVKTPKQMKRIIIRQNRQTIISFNVVWLATHTKQSITNILEFFNLPVQTS